MYNIAIILAGGIGSRLGSEIPKQLLKIRNKTIIEYSIDAFEKNPNIDEIAIVINNQYIDQITNLVSKNNYKKVSKILKGGKERSYSSIAAIKAFSGKKNEDYVNLIFHDSVRPLVSSDIINNVIQALKEHNAVNVGIQCTDTIMQLNDERCIEQIPNRDYLYRTQTPQGFRYSTIDKAYKVAIEDNNFKATDDCGVVCKYLPNENIYVVNGEEKNIKITYKNDLKIMELLL